MPAQDIISMLNVASNRSQAYFELLQTAHEDVRTQKWFDDRCEVRADAIVWGQECGDDFRARGRGVPGGLEPDTRSG